MLEHLPATDGYFQLHHRAVRTGVDDVTLKNFTNLEGDSLRVAFLANIPQVKEFNASLKPLDKDTRDTVVNGRKDAERARRLKDQAGQEVQGGNWARALLLYSSSYLAMPIQNEAEAAVIVANRSAALYHLKQYPQALTDITLSLSLGYPIDLKFKVLDRRARCFLALKWNNDAISAFRETIAALDNAKLPKEKRQKMQTDAQLMIEILNKSNQLLSPRGKPVDTTALIGQAAPKEPTLPSVSGKNSKQYSAATDALEVASSEEEGRYAKATRDVAVGEILLVERAHCAVLLGEYALTHCQHCFLRCISPLACPTCSNVIFCSESCRKKGLEYHQHECPILPLLWDSGCSITCHMALRIISQRDLSYFIEIKSKLQEPMTGKYQSNDYKCVYNLVRHENQRSKADFFQRTHMAVFLLNLLKKTAYFQSTKENGFAQINGDADISESKLNDVESYVGGLILRNLQVLQFNAHEIFETKCDKVEDKPDGSPQVVRKDQGKSIFLGGGLYPSLALFNHSCDPGVVRYFQGTSVIAQAIKNIRSGQQVAENYGPLFTRQAAPTRQAELQERYWFPCHCIPCEESWPLFEDMDETIMRFKCTIEGCNNVIPVSVDCQDFMVKCGLCQQYTNIFKGLKALQDTESASKLALSHMERGEYGRALVKLIEEMRLYDETLAAPFKDFHLCQQNIRRCLLTFGNVNIV